jgi:hypothetical protein
VYKVTIKKCLSKRLVSDILKRTRFHMTIQQTIDIPVSRKVHFDMVLPETVPYGRTEVILDFIPATSQAEPSLPKGKDKLELVLEKALKEAEEKRLYNQAHSAELRGSLKKLQEGRPLFGGIGGDEFKRRCRDEWEERIR